MKPLALAICAATLASAAAAQSVPVATLPFHAPNDLVLLEARVGGSAPLWLILDTGAQRSVIDAGVVDALRIPTGDEGEAVGTAGRASMRWVPRVEVRLGATALAVDSAVAIDLQSIVPAVGHRIDGILGHEVFERFVVEIDYDADSVRLYDPAGFRPDGRGTPIPLEIDERGGVVAGEVTVAGERIPARLFLDTGANGALQLSAPYVRAHRLLERARGVEAVGGVMGVGGTSRSAAGTLDSLRLGGYSLADPPATLSMDTVGVASQEGRAGTVGADVFRRFRMTLDYPHRRMFLEPGRMFAAPFTRALAGVAVLAQGEDFGTLQVAAVTPGSAAERAGLMAGDVILSLDGVAPPALTLHALRDRMRVPGATYRLVVRRGTATREITLTLPAA